MLCLQVRDAFPQGDSMTIRITNPEQKHGYLHPASAYGFMTPDGRWWRSVQHWLEASGYSPPDGEAYLTYIDDKVWDVLRLKFVFNHDIRKLLIDTGKDFIKSTPRTPEHHLGYALGQIRNELQSKDWALNVPWTPFSEASFEGPDVQKAEGSGYVGVFINSRYQVVLSQQEVEGFKGPVDHLSIKRWDRAPCRDWREMQRIKNELLGEDREACEIYPSEQRLVDTANQYHLWVLPKGVMFPFGFFNRVVAHPGANKEAPDAEQRPFESAPPDALGAAEVDRAIADMGEG